MKKLLLGAGACALALVGVGAGLALNANAPVETKAITNNKSFYLDVSDSSFTYWVDDVNENNTDGTGNVVIGAYVWKGGTNTKIRGNRVKGFANTYLFEFVFDLSSYDNVIFFRGKDSLDGEKWYNQTEDVTSYNLKTKNVFKLYNGDGICHEDWNISYSDRAEYYGTYFVSQTSASCASKAAPDNDVWTKLKNEFNAMNSSSQTLVVNAEAPTDTWSTKLAEASRRYNLIVNNYNISGDNEFLNRVSGGEGVRAVSPAAITDWTPAIVISAASFAVIAGGAFLILRRRKEN